MDNSKAELRRWEDNLNVGGLGVVVLGAWTTVRAIIELFADFKDNVMQIRDEMAGGDLMVGYVVMAVIIVIILLFALLILWIHVYIGVNAMKAAREQKYKRGYFVWAIIMLVLTAASLAGYYDILNDLENIDTNIAAILVDLTTIYSFFLVVRSSSKVKQLRMD